MLDVPQDLISFIDRHDSFYIIGHTEPDGDSTGSQIALARFLGRLGKTVSLLSPGPFQRPEIMEFESLFASSLPAPDPHGAVVILDCSTIERIGSLAHDIKGLPVLVIDHHSSGESFGDVRYIDASVPAVALLVLSIIETMGSRPTEEEARMLLFGLCTDTGFFRHLERGNGYVFEAVARLVNMGTSTREIHAMMYGNRSLASRKLLGMLLARSERHFDGRLIYTWETLEETGAHGIMNRDSDTLYQLLQSVTGCEVVVLVREEYSPDSTVPPAEGEERIISAGLRSKKDSFDVGAIARSFGGGGHRQAAGFSKKTRMPALKEELLTALAPLFT